MTTDLKKATPGPWRKVTYNWARSKKHPHWDGRIESPVRLNAYQQEAYILSSSAFGVFGRTDEEAEANATLMAAAYLLPEIREAGWKAVADLSGVHEVTNLQLREQGRLELPEHQDSPMVKLREVLARLDEAMTR